MDHARPARDVCVKHPKLHYVQSDTVNFEIVSLICNVRC